MLSRFLFARFRLLRIFVNCWPPMWANGIRIKYVSPNVDQIDVQIRPRWFSVNVIGTLFGGSLFTMTDPFYMLILLHQIGKEHIVWDKKTSIDFVSPGKNTINVTYKLTPAERQNIVEKCSDGSPLFKTFEVELRDVKGQVVATVEKTVYIRKKKRPVQQKP